MSNVAIWIGAQDSESVLSRGAREINVEAELYRPPVPGTFDFKDGTTQGWSLDQLYDTDDPSMTPLQPFPAPRPGAAAGFTLSNSQNIALAASADGLRADPKVKRLDFYFRSPDLAGNTAWAGIEGFAVDTHRAFFSPCGFDNSAKVTLYTIQLQALFWDPKQKRVRTFGEWDASAKDFVFHRIDIATPLHLSWRADVFGDADLALRWVRVRCTQPNLGSALGGECACSGRWLIGNVTPLF